MKRLFTPFILLCSDLLLHAQTTLMGRVTDENGDGLPYASVILYKHGTYKTGMETDSLGWYLFQNDPAQNAYLGPGTYDIQVSYLGYDDQRQKSVKVYPGASNHQDFVLRSSSIALKTITVVDYRVPFVSSDICYCDGILRQHTEKDPASTPVEENPSGLSIFPNPASTHATILIPAATQGLTLFNLSGQPLRSWTKLEQGPLSFSVSQLPPGNYALLAKTVEGSRYSKLVVTR